MNLTKKQRAELRMKFGGRCAYCGCELPEKGWHADHVEPVDRVLDYVRNEDGWGGKIVATGELGRPERDTLENLNPACASCNLDKHSMSLESWRKAIANKVDVCRYESAFRHAERFGLIIEVQKPVVFWFEQYEGAQ
jgi:5-methylcytosine-specific restriction endonuclease McrA